MTKIEWATVTCNPIVGCSKISPECLNCYAATAAKSARLQQFPQYQGVERWDGTVHFVESQLQKLLHLSKPQRVFLCSMSDIFHDNVPDAWIDRIMAVCAIANQHTYQVLTKRTHRMAKYFLDQETPIRWARIIERDFLSSPCLEYLIEELVGGEFEAKHLWLGTTAGCQDSVNTRLWLLDKLSRKGWTTFVSAEPLLEKIDLGFKTPGYKVSQVIVGAESGRGARGMDEDWVRDVRDQCVENGVAFFYKQDFAKNKKISLPVLDGRQWVEFPF